MLQRTAGILVQATKALAHEERDDRSEKLPTIGFYFIVIVTTADLKVARSDPARVSLSDGTLDHADVVDGPIVRFRKQVLARTKALTPEDYGGGVDPAYAREKHGVRCSSRRFRSISQRIRDPGLFAENLRLTFHRPPSTNPLDSGPYSRVHTNFESRRRIKGKASPVFSRVIELLPSSASNQPHASIRFPSVRPTDRVVRGFSIHSHGDGDALRARPDDDDGTECRDAGGHAPRRDGHADGSHRSGGSSAPSHGRGREDHGRCQGRRREGRLPVRMLLCNRRLREWRPRNRESDFEQFLCGCIGRLPPAGSPFGSARRARPGSDSTPQ